MITHAFRSVLFFLACSVTAVMPVSAEPTSAVPRSRPSPPVPGRPSVPRSRPSPSGPATPAYDLFVKARPGVVLIRSRFQIGAGFLVAPNLVVTNYHVVNIGRHVKITAFNGKKTTGKVISYDKKNDLALIRLPKVLSGTRPLVLATNLPAKGTPTIIIGHPRANFTGKSKRWGLLRWTWSKGLLINANDRVVQTSANTYPGNSGGPLIDYRGKVIGVMTYVADATLAFAMHVRHVHALIKRKPKGYPHRWRFGYLCGLGGTFSIRRNGGGGLSVEVGLPVTWNNLEFMPFASGTFSTNNKFNSDKQFNDYAFGLKIGYRFVIPVVGLPMYLIPYTGFMARFREYRRTFFALEDPTCTAECEFEFKSKKVSSSFRPVVPVGLRLKLWFMHFSLSFEADTKDIKESTISVSFGFNI